MQSLTPSLWLSLRWLCFLAFMNLFRSDVFAAFVVYSRTGDSQQSAPAACPATKKRQRSTLRASVL